MNLGTSVEHPLDVGKAWGRMSDEGLQIGATWSPDGRFIAYCSDRGGKSDIWMQQVTASANLRLADIEAMQ